ncbi:hypothetical protein ACTXT7_008777 [Hymenolepis weldensis]
MLVYEVRGLGFDVHLRPPRVVDNVHICQVRGHEIDAHRVVSNIDDQLPRLILFFERCGGEAQDPFSLPKSSAFWASLNRLVKLTNTYIWDHFNWLIVRKRE